MRLANPGFSLLLGMTETYSRLSDKLLQSGLILSGSSRVGSGGEFDPLFIAWNKKALVHALAVAQLIPSQALVTFGHDCIPVYVVSPISVSER